MLPRSAVTALLAVLAAAPGGARGQEVQTAAPHVLLQQVPGVYRFQVGKIRITALSDGPCPRICTSSCLERGSQARRAARQGYLANPVEASINVYLLESGDRRILVDAGAGDLSGQDTAASWPELNRGWCSAGADHRHPDHPYPHRIIPAAW